MPYVIVGYGDYRGYRLAELPSTALDELAARYPVQVSEHYRPDYNDLYITVAIEAELRRRKCGGSQQKRVPSLRELALEIVNKGYQQASKGCHPDGKGNHEAQIRLNQARDQLRESAMNLPDEADDQDSTVIPAPSPPRQERARPIRTDFEGGITDDDVPF